MTKRSPILLLKNNTDSVQQVNLFNVRPNLSGNINAPIIAQWEIFSQSLFGVKNLQIQVSTPGQLNFTVLTADILSGSIRGILAALNSLNIGYFYATTLPDSIIINSANNIFTYGDLTINITPGNAQWIANGNILITNAGVYLAAFLEIDNNRSGTNLSLDQVPFAAAPNNLVVNDNISFSYDDLSPGDSLRLTLSFQGGVAPPGVTIQVSVLQNGLPFYTGPSETDPFGFYQKDFGNYTLGATYTFIGTMI